MDHPKTFLLKKIMSYQTNGFKSLGRLNAEHIDDLSEIMLAYATGMAKELIDILNKGESVNVNGEVFCIAKKLRK